MSRFLSSYQVARPTGVCAASGRRLEPGTECIATLCEREGDEGLDRLDFAIDAWDAGHRPPRLFSYWRMRVPASHEKRRLLVDDQVLLDLFDRMAEDQRPQRIAFRFVLALILMRKRLLKFAGRAGEGESERWLLAPRGGEGPPHEVANPHLSDEDVRELTDQLGEILQSEL